ncbi:hypothetical protein JX265_010578 [Neoarthrinium moseri]|uniref:EngB-type G domain-containing protein n=1 Tax=Neoarthrinium moseri TaxID=1658444 RepID=A0A9P9WE85_9PEZI|nr:hypothetical protein JX265_010578 [Neoarthrinium moseri]
MAPRQITALLAMPASLRPLLFTAQVPPPSWAQSRGFHATGAYASRYMKKPLTVGAFTIPHSPTLPLTDIPIKELLESPIPNESIQDQLTTLFIKNPATFYHGTSDFYELKKNTRIPEICILGRSNVGKSTFVNALANRRDKELAHTSARAGRTKAMNAFGFGPAPLMKDLADTDIKTKRTEDLPKHTFFVVDMPGYGHKSLKEWGKHISLYLNKRQSVKGAVLLIDGEVGPKDGDLMALELLQEAGVRTAIVLTKADKAKHEEMLRDTCRRMWMAMRDVNNRDLNSKWTWEKDFFVTALGATKKEIGADTVSIARLAVARLAGLVQEKERPEVEAPKGYTGKVVSFEDLQFAPSPTPAASAPTPPTIASTSSGFTDLERAAMDQHKARMASRSSLDTTPSWDLKPTTRNPQRTQTRALHTLPGANRPEDRELQGLLKEFMSTLKVKHTPMDEAARSRNLSHRDRERNAAAKGKPLKPKIWDPTFVPPNKEQRQRAKRLRQRHAELYDRRLEFEERSAARKAERAAQMDAERRERGRATWVRRDADAPYGGETASAGFGEGEGEGEEGPEDPEERERRLAESWDQIEEAQRTRQLHGKKAKKAKKEAEKKKKGKGRKGDDDGDDDAFAAQFARAF